MLRVFVYVEWMNFLGGMVLCGLVGVMIMLIGWFDEVSMFWKC